MEPNVHYFYAFFFFLKMLFFLSLSSSIRRITLFSMQTVAFRRMHFAPFSLFLFYFIHLAIKKNLYLFYYFKFYFFETIKRAESSRFISHIIKTLILLFFSFLFLFLDFKYIKYINQKQNTNL
jgi:hypothetical protein